MFYFLFFLVLAYLIGALPTGAWIARLVGIEDITQHGSGNIGATNVGRLLGVQYFFIVLCIDVFKAFMFMHYVCQHYYQVSVITLFGVFLLLGNSFSCFLGGKGGKGIATSIGIMSALQGFIVQYAFIVWFGTFFVTRNVGISSAMVLLVLPVITLCLAPSYIILALFISLWGLWRHASNIKTFIRSMVFKSF